MSKNNYINFDEKGLMAYHEELMDEIYNLYHVHPTNIPHIDISDNEAAETAVYTAMADMQAKGRSSKKVVFYSRRYPNGR